MKNFHRKNHFVPQSYLKGWSLDGKKIWVYQILVNHKDVPLWKLDSIRSVACHKHLYTKISTLNDINEVDDFERWLEKEFETPAQEALYKVIHNTELSETDMKNLINYTAAQIVRTPAMYEKVIERCLKEMPGIIENTIKEAAQNIKEFSERIQTQEIADNNELFPVSIS